MPLLLWLALLGGAVGVEEGRVRTQWIGPQRCALSTKLHCEVDTTCYGPAMHGKKVSVPCHPNAGKATKSDDDDVDDDSNDDAPIISKLSVTTCACAKLRGDKRDGTMHSEVSIVLAIMKRCSRACVGHKGMSEAAMEGATHLLDCKCQDGNMPFVVRQKKLAKGIGAAACPKGKFMDSLLQCVGEVTDQSYKAYAALRRRRIPTPRATPSPTPLPSVHCPKGKYITPKSKHATVGLADVMLHPERFVCKECPINSYMPGHDRTRCYKCPHGKFSRSAGAVHCRRCPPRTVPNLNEHLSSGAALLANCAPKTPPPQRRRRRLRGNLRRPVGGKCSVGYFRLAAHCVNCRRDVCAACPRGRYGQGSRTECTACPVGEFNPKLAQSRCYKCARGYTTRAAGAWRCVSSAAPSTGNPQGSKLRAGLICAAGKRTAGANPLPGLAPTCRSCQAGKYQPLPGKHNCSSCSPGHYQARVGSRACFACRLGTYTGTSGALLCAACPLGKHTQHFGSAACKWNKDHFGMFKRFPAAGVVPHKQKQRAF